MKKVLKDNYIWILLFTFLISLISLIVCVSLKENLILDEKGYYLISNLINDNITPIVKIITFLASTTFFIGLSIL